MERPEWKDSGEDYKKAVIGNAQVELDILKRGANHAAQSGDKKNEESYQKEIDTWKSKFKGKGVILN